MEYYNLSVDDALEKLSVSKDTGIDNKESSKRLTEFGKKKLT